MSKYVPPFRRRNNDINSNTTSVPNRTNTYNPIHSTNINYNVPITNNRWSLDRNPTETSSSYRINYSNPVNSKGFHGFIVPSGLIENSLFKNNIYTNDLIDFERYNEIPIEVSGDDIPEPIDKFNVESLCPELMANIERSKFTRPTPVQKYSIPIGCNKRDMVACAQTGSGKTVGYLFPLISSMIRDGPLSHSSDHRIYPTALIITPTRELAEQVFKETEKYCYLTGIFPVAVYGGMQYKDQCKQVEKGADIIIGTPGRIAEFYARGKISFSGIRFLILDEADRMLDMGFLPQIKQIVFECDMPKERQTFMFSATFPKEIQLLAQDYLNNYIFLAVGVVGSAAEEIEQIVKYVDENDKEYEFQSFIEHNPEEKVIVFTNTKRQADILENNLRRRISCIAIHSDKSQDDRNFALKQFRNGSIKVLIATDVAARGLDIPNVNYVINYDLPTNIEYYIHRIGRTGRAGHKGFAISYYNQTNNQIANSLKVKLAENNQVIPDFLMNDSYQYYRRGNRRKH